MIIELPGTTVNGIARALVTAREEGGVSVLGRVLSLLVVTESGHEEQAIRAANAASYEHPMRVIVVMSHPDEPSGLDAEIRVGGDAGASEVIILHARGAAATADESLVAGLLLPDAPVVTWWHRNPPASPAESPFGRISDRRITDAVSAESPIGWLDRITKTYSPGDTDLAWTRLTRWREQLAAALDDPDLAPVRSAEVVGADATPSAVIMAAWLELQLRVPVRLRRVTGEEWKDGLRSVTLTFDEGSIELARVEGADTILTVPDYAPRHLVLARRTLRECLTEELRRLDEDIIYGRVVTQALPGILARLEEPAPAAAPATVSAPGAAPGTTPAPAPTDSAPDPNQAAAPHATERNSQ